MKNEMISSRGVECGTGEGYEMENVFEPVVIKSQEEYDDMISTNARKIAREMMAKERERKKRASKIRRKKLWKFVFLVMLICVLGICISHNYPIPKYDKETQTICRNLDYADSLIPALPELPEMAWSEDLPSFIEKDLDKVINEGWRVRYNFVGYTINIKREQSIWVDDYYLTMTVDGVEDKDDVYVYRFNNSSVYIDDGMLKWYCWSGDNEFDVVKISDTIVKQETLSNNAKNVPITVDDTDSWRIDDYVLVQNENELSLWKDGYEEASITSEIGDIACIHGRYALLLTTDHKMYGIDIYESTSTDYLPQIYLSYIGKIDDVSDVKFYYPENEFFFEFPRESEYAFPIVKSKDESYVVLPEDISNYVSYSLANKGKIAWARENVNLKRSMVKIADLNLVSANIHYDYSSYMFEGFGWVADVEVEYNGVTYHYKDYPIYGYDRQFYLTDAEKEKLTTTVYSVEEYWLAVEAIRETYQNYYERQGG
ncbi:MAG: hypothetical protein K1W33_07225 [Clostridia bacterium]